MVTSEQDTLLFFAAVEELGPNKPNKAQKNFQSLEDLLVDKGLGYQQAMHDDKFIRAAVWYLSSDNPFSENYIMFFGEVHPKRSANYLVGALANPFQRPAVVDVLLKYGPSDVTIRPLVAALANPKQVGPAMAVLIAYGRAALPFIRPPHPGSRIYAALTEVLNMIHTNAT